MEKWLKIFIVAVGIALSIYAFNAFSSAQFDRQLKANQDFIIGQILNSTLEHDKLTQEQDIKRENDLQAQKIAILNNITGKIDSNTIFVQSNLTNKIDQNTALLARLMKAQNVTVVLQEMDNDTKP